MTQNIQGTAFIDAQYVPIAEAKISLLDWGFLHSDATYDVVHVKDGKLFRINDHIDRLFNGMSALRMTIPYSREELVEILSNCVSQSGLQDAYVEMITTRGQPAPGSRDPRTCENRFFAFAIPFVWITPPDKGLELIISEKQRIPSQSVNPTVKNYHWLDLVMAQYEAYDQESQTAVVVNANGNITEGPGFNVFAIKDNVLTTPAEGVLHGITRQTAIELGTKFGYKVVLDELTPTAAHEADELFATSTAGGIMAITKIDHRDVSSGTIGAITQQLQSAYWKLHHNPQYSLPIKY